MKSTIIKREVEFNVQLTEKEVRCIAEVFRQYLEHNGNPVVGVAYETGKAFQSLLESAGLAVSSCVYPDKIHNKELLDNKYVYIGKSTVIDFNAVNCEKDEFKFMMGDKGQLAICTKITRSDRYDNNTFFNRYCAKLIRDFITTEGQGKYGGCYSAVNTGSCYQLDMYIDKEGHTLVQGLPGKSLMLRWYYKNLSTLALGIIKNDGAEILLNYKQAQILKKFIENHI